MHINQNTMAKTVKPSVDKKQSRFSDKLQKTQQVTDHPEIETSQPQIAPRKHQLAKNMIYNRILKY